jgi:hypothetical protein
MEAQTRRRAIVLLFLLLTLVSFRLVVTYWDLLLEERSPLLYQAATLGFNYFDFGAVRRGLGGSIVYLLGDNLLRATAVFHILSSALVAAAACWFFARLRRPALQTSAFAILLVAIMMRWAEDAGRTDVLVAALLALAAIGAIKGRWVLACCGVAVGLAVHETSFIFGIPLLAGLCVDHERWRKISKSEAVGALAVLSLALVLYFFVDRLPHADAQTMVQTVRARLPPDQIVDWAIYFAVSGARGVRTSLCQHSADPTYFIHLLSGLVVIGLFAGVLVTRRGPPVVAVLIVSVIPFLFLSVFAIDLGRWAVLAAFNVWLLCAASPFAPCAAPERLMGVRLLTALLTVPLIHPKTLPVDVPVFAPTPVIDRIVQKFGGPRTPKITALLERCDPEWRVVLGNDAAQRTLE